MTATPALLPGGFAWTHRDRFKAAAMALALDMAGKHSHADAVRAASASLIAGESPTLALAWVFCQAARLIQADDGADNYLAPLALQAGCRIGLAVVVSLGVPLVLDVTRTEFGMTVAYIARTPRGAVQEIDGAVIGNYVVFTNAGCAELDAREAANVAPCDFAPGCAERLRRAYAEKRAALPDSDATGAK